MSTRENIRLIARAPLSLTLSRSSTWNQNLNKLGRPHIPKSQGHWPSGSGRLLKFLPHMGKVILVP